MSQELQNALKRLLPFAGVPSYDRQIAYVNKMLLASDDKTTDTSHFTDVRPDLVGDDAQEDEAEEIVFEAYDDTELRQGFEGATQRLGNLSAYGAYNSVYVDALTGDDANDGKTPDTPIKTCSRLIELLSRVDVDYVYVTGEFVIDKRTNIWGPLARLEFIGVGDDASIRLVNDGAKGGGFVMFGGGYIAFSGLDLVDDTTGNDSPIRGTRGSYNLQLKNVEVSRTAASIEAHSYPMFNLEFVDLSVSGLVLDESTSGILLAGVDSGANPNDARHVRSTSTVL